jgi:hypothetical protein
MPNDIFEINRDLSIRYFNASIGAFVEIVADSFEIDIDRGIDVENGVFAEGAIGTATVKLVKKNLSDFLGTPGYKAGQQFDIRYRPLPDSVPALYNVLYGGWIQNVSMNYINESQTLEITIVANDAMKVFQNTVIPSFSVSGTVVNRSFRNCMTSLTTAINAATTYPGGISLTALGAGASGTTQRAFTWIDTPSGEIASKFMDAELGWYFTGNGGGVQYLTRTDINTLQARTFTAGQPTVSNVHSSSANHFCLDNINLRYDSDILVNKCIVIDGTAGTKTVRSNTTSIAANGEQSGTFTVDFDPAGASTYAQWATEVANAATIKQVYGVGVPPVRDDGKVGDIANWGVGTTLQVEFAQSGLPTLQVISIVSRINHIITPQHWEMNIGLWRGM